MLRIEVFGCFRVGNRTSGLENPHNSLRPAADHVDEQHSRVGWPHAAWLRSRILRRIRDLGWSASETSLFTNATGTRALSYMSHRSFSTLVRTPIKFRKSAAFGCHAQLVGRESDDVNLAHSRLEDELVSIIGGPPVRICR